MFNKEDSYSPVLYFKTGLYNFHILKNPKKTNINATEVTHKLSTSLKQVQKYIQVKVLKVSKNKDGYSIQAKDYDTFLEKFGNEISKQFYSVS